MMNTTILLAKDLANKAFLLPVSETSRARKTYSSLQKMSLMLVLAMSVIFIAPAVNAWTAAGRVDFSPSPASENSTVSGTVVLDVTLAADEQEFSLVSLALTLQFVSTEVLTYTSLTIPSARGLNGELKTDYRGNPVPIGGIADPSFVESSQQLLITFLEPQLLSALIYRVFYCTRPSDNDTAAGPVLAKNGTISGNVCTFTMFTIEIAVADIIAANVLQSYQLGEVSFDLQAAGSVSGWGQLDASPSSSSLTIAPITTLRLALDYDFNRDGVVNIPDGLILLAWIQFRGNYIPSDALNTVLGVFGTYAIGFFDDYQEAVSVIDEQLEAVLPRNAVAGDRRFAAMDFNDDDAVNIQDALIMLRWILFRSNYDPQNALNTIFGVFSTHELGFFADSQAAVDAIDNKLAREVPQVPAQ